MFIEKPIHAYIRFARGDLGGKVEYRNIITVGGLRRVRMSKAGGVSNVELSTNLEKTCRMMSYHAVVRIS